MRTLPKNRDEDHLEIEHEMGLNSFSSLLIPPLQITPIRPKYRNLNWSSTSRNLDFENISHWQSMSDRLSLVFTVEGGARTRVSVVID